ncbi:hypothetical protein BLNAU_20815 [Blattamonas nauphoetae]|uniref:Rho-GAP domain-containing protein n=1 Tax=Blattamonas nauphoetae TaxID=2049346 RepID=A0ABQ9WXK7_9EUKA|nr:hypothetical protein BLNAU_20815 [Blattamonas nauphoetae]
MKTNGRSENQRSFRNQLQLRIPTVLEKTNFKLRWPNSSNNFVDGLVRRIQHYLFSAALLCCAVDNRPIPPCIVNKVSDQLLCFIHPFIIRGLGSIILQHADKGFQATVFVLFSYLLKEARARLEWLPTSLSVSRVIPSSQIVDTATAFLQLYFDRLTRSTFLPPLLEVIAQLSAFSISTASLQSVVRFFRLLTRLLSISHPSLRIRQMPIFGL